MKIFALQLNDLRRTRGKYKQYKFEYETNVSPKQRRMYIMTFEFKLSQISTIFLSRPRNNMLLSDLDLIRYPNQFPRFCLNQVREASINTSVSKNSNRY